MHHLRGQCNTDRPLCPKGVYPLKRLLQNLAWGGSSRFAPHAIFHRCGFKNVGLQPQNRQNW